MPDLSARQREVAQHVTAGLSNRAISENLGVAESTVASHVHTILGILGLKTRTEIAVWWIRNHNDLQEIHRTVDDMPSENEG